MIFVKLVRGTLRKSNAAPLSLAKKETGAAKEATRLRAVKIEEREHLRVTSITTLMLDDGRRAIVPHLTRSAAETVRMDDREITSHGEIIGSRSTGILNNDPMIGHSG